MTLASSEDVRIFSLVLPRPIAFTYVLSILYNVTFFMQFVSTPFLIKALGVSDAENGLLQSLFGVLQMAGGPLFGYVIQRWGLRRALFLCYGSTLTSGVLLLFSQDLWWLVASRVPALLMHGQQGHQTLLSALTRPGQERTNAFGRMGLTFGIGFMFTPLLCFCSSRLLGDRAPFLVSACLCLLPLVVLETMIPRESYESAGTDEEDTAKEGKSMTVSNSLRILLRPGVLNVLFKKNAPIVPALLLFSIMQLFMINEFKMDPDTNHVIQGVTGVYIMLSNGFGVIWLRTKFEEQTLVAIGMFSFLWGFVLFFFFSRLWLIFLIMPFISLGMSLVATVADSMLTSLVHEDEQGLVLGVSTSFNSLVRTVAPALAGSLLDSRGFFVFPLIGVCGAFAGLSALFVLPLDPNLITKKHKTQ